MTRYDREPKTHAATDGSKSIFTLRGRFDAKEIYSKLWTAGTLRMTPKHTHIIHDDGTRDHIMTEGTVNPSSNTVYRLRKFSNDFHKNLMIL
jgi:hypothetical protein